MSYPDKSGEKRRVNGVGWDGGGVGDGLLLSDAWCVMVIVEMKGDEEDVVRERKLMANDFHISLKDVV
ncbi:hypothetical protein Tco_1407620 [Tanacetum coccineum]